MTTPKRQQDLIHSRRIPLLQRLMKRVSVQENGCWTWTGKTRADGYGSFKRNDERYALAHRLMYEEVIGAIPTGLVLDHLCRHPSCVNPAHLEAVTQRENILRGSNRLRDITHCKRGHELSGDNLLKGVGRICKACTTYREKQRAEEIRNGATPRTKNGELCVNGHRYSDNPIAPSANGCRRCGACVKAAAARMRHKYKELRRHAKECQTLATEG